MEQSRSRDALAGFLEYLAAKGLMAPATVQARKAAASRVLGILDEEEARDVTTLDLDGLFSRFQNLHGKDFTPDSLRTYKSRLKSALDDFRAYLDNPLAFRPSVQGRAARQPASKSTDTEARKSQEHRTSSDRPPPPAASTSILPIPIRADLTIFIQGLPFDLSELEARKISAVVNALATS